ncbi:unnamed protein product [Larinioides sclopetarius]|uniref:Caspase family p20 domain-containing protein n=1 Tax=Larinioides sclopetarius TaxID=280406 RepID=A0AAV2BJ30_9ARAC
MEYCQNLEFRLQPFRATMMTQLIVQNKEKDSLKFRTGYNRIQILTITTGRRSEGDRRVIPSRNNTHKLESESDETLIRSGPQTSVVTYSERSDNDDRGLIPDPSESKVGEIIMNPTDEPNFGDCYIFNYQEFKEEPPRPGSKKDVDRLRHDFKELNFNVYEHSNLTKKDILDKLKKGFSCYFENMRTCVTLNRLQPARTVKISFEFIDGPFGSKGMKIGGLS